jgi:hypothetical protein
MSRIEEELTSIESYEIVNDQKYQSCEDSCDGKSDKKEFTRPAPNICTIYIQRRWQELSLSYESTEYEDPRKLVSCIEFKYAYS